MALRIFKKTDFDFFISRLEEIKGWIKEAKIILDIEDYEKYTLIGMPANRTRMQEFMNENPDDVTENAAQKLHDFDMFVYENIDLAYKAFSEFYWKRSEYAPSKSHWWWWLDEYFEGRIEINPDDVWIKWEKIRGEKGLK